MNPNISFIFWPVLHDKGFPVPEPPGNFPMDSHQGTTFHINIKEQPPSTSRDAK